MISGSHDSLVAPLAAQHPRFTACVHIDTGIGIGIEETQEFVRETSYREGWPLVELVTPPSVYEELVLTYGFSGYGMHLRAAARIFELERRVLEAGSPPRPWSWTGDKMGTRALCQQCRLRDPDVLRARQRTIDSDESAAA